MGKNLITREQYKKIKKKDHTEMSQFFLKVWQDGYNDGVVAGRKNKAPEVKPKDIEQVLENVKGIGEIQIKAIMQQVYKLYEGENID